MKCEPIEAVFLGLDPAKHTSGATILIPDYGNSLVGEEEHPFEGQYALSEFGKVTSQSERGRFTESAVETALDMKLPLVVVAEVWEPPRNKKLRLPGNQAGLLMDPKWTYQTVLGIGEGWGRWAAELDSANEYLREEEKLPPFPILRATPNVWRDELWGPGRPKDSTALKATAKRYFEGVFGFPASDDISEAGCIALWGTTSTLVADAVRQWEAAKPKKKSKNARKAERRSRAS